ncbi:MAG: hypothetical protein F4W95_11475 [Chloroflexi bacterium]|nr:hypothetical protein [Chloroflexota bacterium]MYD49086.1 hypothetical protein [Chloroflexota bacterium]
MKLHLAKLPLARRLIAPLRTVPIVAALGLWLTATGCFLGGGDLPSVAYVSGDQDQARVWISQPGEDEPVNISPRNARAGFPRWSAEQRYLAWISNREVPLLMVYDVTTEETELLVSGIDPSQPPVWAPEADRVAYVSDAGGSPDIYMVELATGQATRLTFSQERETIGDWSPDGQWLVFTEAGRDGLLLRNPTGVNRIELTDGADSHPVWSPKGDRIAFVRETERGQDIYVLRPTRSDNWADDTDEVAVANDEYDELQPAWSADGRRLAFVVQFDDQSDIFTVLSDGSQREQLTYNTVDDMMPVWSGRGDKIAFVSHAYGNSEILYMNRDGADQIRLTTTDQMDSHPDW